MRTYPQLELGGQPTRLIIGALALSYVPEQSERRGFAFPVDRDDAHLSRPRGGNGDDVDLARLAWDEGKPSRVPSSARTSRPSSRSAAGLANTTTPSRSITSIPSMFLAYQRPQTLLRDR
ncbi:MAG: hypothetical protein WCD11_23275 [Solirubrobacteraceae bacterium]